GRSGQHEQDQRPGRDDEEARGDRRRADQPELRLPRELGMGLQERLFHAALEVRRGLHRLQPPQRAEGPLELGQLLRASLALLVVTAQHPPLLLSAFAPEVGRDLGRFFTLHDSSATESRSFSLSIAVCILDFTVPTGTPRISPMSWYFIPWISLRITTAFCSSGSWSIARRSASCCSSRARISTGPGTLPATRSCSVRPPSPPSGRSSESGFPCTAADRIRSIHRLRAIRNRNVVNFACGS